MNLLRDASLIYASAFSFVLLMILFESRYSPKKTACLALLWMLPLLVVNFILYFVLGPEKMSTLLLLTCSLPSLAFFWVLAKHRGGRFFFTFCLADTLTLEIIYVTAILDFFLGNRYMFMFVSRLLLCPLLAWALFKYVRPMYLELQSKVRKGWYVFTAIALLFYVVLSLSISVPTMITRRPEQLPAFVLLLILMPAIYIQIFLTLLHQQTVHEAAERENILKLQVAGMAARMEEYSAADEKFRLERHDFRHKLHTIAGMVEKGRYEELHALVLEYDRPIGETRFRRYCSHPVMDAALSSYIQRAEGKGIRVATRLAFPQSLPANETELATVFANAIENAIHACQRLVPEKRYIEIASLTEPCFMVQIKNSFDGVVEFDKNGLPVTREEGHGFGTRSIAAFCEKHGAVYQFKATEDTFCLWITFG